ncbi:DNA repair protein RadA, partial [bacterium]|nr:DNA repair protein RadA [bacterium]
GSFVILTGDPGIGKSTLLLQVAHKISEKEKVIYFSSEESLGQVKNRAERLGLRNTNTLFSDKAVIEDIIATAQNEKPALLIIDSIQSCHFQDASRGIPGSIAQLREAAFTLMRTAKENNVSILVTGHITKDGNIAGPKLLEHMVDGVFYLKGDDQWQTRVLRSVKNRFGAVNEVGFFEMHSNGMVEVSNISKQILKEASNAPGSVLVCSIEGQRPILAELQALCIESKFGNPQRVVSGVDYKRVVLVAAILEKYLHLKFSSCDIFFKTSGGIQVRESASDLGIAFALISSYLQQSLPEKTVAVGEVNLAGQVRAATQAASRISEAGKFGAAHVLTPHRLKTCETLKLHVVRNVYEALSLFPEPKRNTNKLSASSTTSTSSS